MGVNGCAEHWTENAKKKKKTESTPAICEWRQICVASLNLFNRCKVCSKPVIYERGRDSPETVMLQRISQDVCVSPPNHNCFGHFQSDLKMLRCTTVCIILHYYILIQPQPTILSGVSGLFFINSSISISIFHFPWWKGRNIWILLFHQTAHLIQMLPLCLYDFRVIMSIVFKLKKNIPCIYIWPLTKVVYKWVHSSAFASVSDVLLCLSLLIHKVELMSEMWYWSRTEWIIST